MNHIKPGGWVRVIQDGEKLKKGDIAVIFTIEKGLSPIQYGVHCVEKDLWEFFEREQIK